MQNPSNMSATEIVAELNQMLEREGFYDDQYYESAMCIIDLLGISYQVNALHRNDDPTVVATIDLLAIPQGTTCTLEVDRDWLDRYLTTVHDFCELYNI
jgi:hypothetical protein